MTKVQALLQEAKRLTREEQKELAAGLERSLRASLRKRLSSGPYASLLKLAGTADSDFRDVSRNKKKHLGEIYAGRRRS